MLDFVFDFYYNRGNGGEMSSIIKLTENEHHEVSDYIYKNFWSCVEIAKIFDKNGLKNKLSDKNSGDFLGFINDDNVLEGIFVFTNNKRLLLHFVNDEVSKKVDLLKAIKHYKPEYMSGPSEHVQVVWKMFERTVKRYKYTDSMYMVLENHQDLIKGFESEEMIRQASKEDAREQMKFFLELEKSFRRNHMTINQIQKRILERIGSNEYLVIEKNGHLIAQGFVEDKIKAFSQIGGIYVSESERGHMYGKKIVEHLSYYILKKGQIPMLAVLKDNKVAVHIYEAIGFVNQVDFSIVEIEF